MLSHGGADLVLDEALVHWGGERPSSPRRLTPKRNRDVEIAVFTECSDYVGAQTQDHTK
jgi:hypothetical protein